MASINDFKLVNEKSKKYFDLFSKLMDASFENLTEIKRVRYGFYFFMLENICDIKDVLDICDLITDMDFNKEIFGETFEDYGIDAIYIDKENRIINLFNFKFREKFNKDKSQSINETVISTKFVNALINENISHLDNKLKKYAQLIVDNLNSNEVWEWKLYVVSNESVELNRNEPSLKQLEQLYDLEIIPLGLNNIKELMSLRPEPINAKLIVDKDAIMSFSESSISSSKSYILRLPINELIRISVRSKEVRMNYGIEDYTSLFKEELEFSVLFDNVRGFVMNSKYNDNIEKTLISNPTKFFMYNNGITITANDVSAEPVNAGKKVILTINNFQVLNGGQSLRTIHNFNKKSATNIIENLANSEILVRVFKTTSDTGLINKIAEYTNSQNAISSIDLKSLSSEQIEIEQFLDVNNIIYARKNGDTGISSNKSYDYKISMERLGQILFSINGFPEKASNQKKDIFEKYYDSIFGSESLDLNKLPTFIRNYFLIKHKYDTNSKGYLSSEQKIFYIVYINQHLEESLDKQIERFEELISSFEPEGNKNIADSRKLIQLKFREYVEAELKIK
ncbi:AIPR family protein [Runella sp. SP2]|uniref:AIPR family protein n=1 Tax=Runella sp. SP2 TaxID=2268026 RepID=UPI000F08EB7B|nr:AIPR family protein [Runella sp. SP2]AYQ31160.1 abortive phage resistance protein [Runella sp. SP2]